MPKKSIFERNSFKDPFHVAGKDELTVGASFKHFWEGFDPLNSSFGQFLSRHVPITPVRHGNFQIFSVFFPSLFRRISHRFSGSSTAPLPRLSRRDGIRVFYTGEPVSPDMRHTEFALSFDHEDIFGHPRQFRVPLYAHWIEPEQLLKHPGETDEPGMMARRFCNFVYFRPAPFREEFFRKLSKYKKVDAPGLSCSNCPPIAGLPTPLASRLSSRWTSEKREFLSRYKFTIAFENVLMSGYTTEKICDAMAARSIPIYWGNPDIHRDFNPKSFVNLHDFSSIDEAIEYIVTLDRDDALYKNVLAEPYFHENKANKYFSADYLEPLLHSVFLNK